MSDQEKKPFEAPDQKEAEKKDAGAQSGCGLSICSNCGRYVISM